MVDFDLIGLSEDVEQEVKVRYHGIEATALKNHRKVLEAFQRCRVSDFHLKGGTGYGYGDPGRNVLEQVYADIFKAEAALVRGQIVSGTHALALCLFGVLRPGDELLFLQGDPYDTLEGIIGYKKNTRGSLRDFGIKYIQSDLLAGGDLDRSALAGLISNQTRMVLLQRSRGYSLKPCLSLARIEQIIELIKNINKGIVILVDNCYGEFVEDKEPTEVGADLVAGSLIKNPGGGLAPSGGYVVGRKSFVELASARWTAPGIGGEVGPAPDYQRLLYQGLFLAPHVVSEALKGAVFSARYFERLGFEVLPKWDHCRTDIIQSISLGSPRRLVAFCQGIQAASPVDAHVRPEPTGMPGYEDSVIMAAGTFVQGASLELTADGPMREPYAVYMQGGLSKEYIKLGILSAARNVLNCKI